MAKASGAKRALVLALASTAVLAPAGPSLAKAPVAAHTDSADFRKVCEQIAAYVMPTDQLVSQSARSTPALVKALAARSQGFQELEQKYPGSLDAAVEAVKPVVAAWSAQIAPNIRADFAGLYAANLTPQEARIYLRFVSDANIQQFSQSVSANAQFENTATDAAANGSQIGTKGLREDYQLAVKKALAHLTPAQKIIIANYLQSSAAVKMRQLGPKRLEIQAKWSNYSTPAFEQQIMRAMVMAVASHIDQTDPATAERIRGTYEAEHPNGSPGQPAS